LVTDPQYQGILLAVASTSLEPTYSHACLQAIEILPGKTIHHLLHYQQIGRAGKLTSRKTSHFRELHRDSGVDYDEMIFFDGTYGQQIVKKMCVSPLVGVALFRLRGMRTILFV
jgi:Acid Phosphatase